MQTHSLLDSTFFLLKPPQRNGFQFKGAHFDLSITLLASYPVSHRELHQIQSGNTSNFSLDSLEEQAHTSFCLSSFKSIQQPILIPCINTCTSVAGKCSLSLPFSVKLQKKFNAMKSKCVLSTARTCDPFCPISAFTGVQLSWVLAPTAYSRPSSLLASWSRRAWEQKLKQRNFQNKVSLLSLWQNQRLQCDKLFDMQFTHKRCSFMWMWVDKSLDLLCLDL